MHSFQPSRGRILFETLCAWIIAASFALAWMDLGTPAFLPAAGVAALYGFVHLFDMRRPKPAVAPLAEAEMAEEAKAEPEPPVAEPIPEPEPILIRAIEEAAPEAAAPAAKPRKKRARKAPALVEVTLPEPEPVAEAEPMAVEDVAEPAPEEPEMPRPVAESDASEWPEDHAPVTPLFEPQPLVRQQRTVFGRKAG